MGMKQSNMYQNNQLNAIAAIRVSTTRQGTEGDSPEAQKEQIERFAEMKGVKLKEVFLFLESGSKEKQPMQLAIDYCKDPKHKINVFIIKSIDRFTRGGSYVYSNLKRQLDDCGVQLVDIYGIIGAQKVNTLEHLGFSYKWSVYDPTKNSEILEAERASDEKRDIMSRMIGAEIRYTRLGYWMRQAPFGLLSQRVDTIHGTRLVLVPDPKSSPWVISMFELKARRSLTNDQIAEIINGMGYRSPLKLVRDKKNRMRIISKQGGNKLTAKALDRYIKNPLYAGVICEKWTNFKPIKGRFKGLISIELFNAANYNRIAIKQVGNNLELENLKIKPKPIRQSINQIYPYKFVVSCPVCGRPFCGSASRGKNGVKYPAYHCSNYGHYIRIPNVKFEQAIYDFASNIIIKPEYIEKIIQTILVEWHKRKIQDDNKLKAVQAELARLDDNIKLLVSNMKYMQSVTSISYSENEIATIESEMRYLEAVMSNAQSVNSAPVELIETKSRKLLSDTVELIKKSGCNNGISATLFALLFDKIPTFTEISEFDSSSLCEIFEFN